MDRLVHVSVYVDPNEELQRRQFTENELLRLQRREALKERHKQRQAEKKILAPKYAHVERLVTGVINEACEEDEWWLNKRSVMLGSFVEVWSGSDVRIIQHDVHINSNGIHIYLLVAFVMQWVRGEVVGIGTDNSVHIQYFGTPTNRWGQELPSRSITKQFGFDSVNWRNICPYSDDLSTVSLIRFADFCFLCLLSSSSRPEASSDGQSEEEAEQSPVLLLRDA
jgi:hypothetical protein